MEELPFPGSICPIPGTLAQATIDFISSAPFVVELCQRERENGNAFTDFINDTVQLKKAMPFMSFINIDIQDKDITTILPNFLQNYLIPISSLSGLFNFENNEYFSPNIIKFVSNAKDSTSNEYYFHVLENDIEYNLFSFIIADEDKFNTLIVNNENSFYNLETNETIEKGIKDFEIIAFLYSTKNRTIPTLPKIGFFRHSTGTPHKAIIDNPTICLSKRIEKGKEYGIEELILKLDDISYEEGRHLGVHDKKDRFRAICSEANCKARVIGSVKYDKVVVSKVIDHTCSPSGYFMNKETKTKLTSTNYCSKNLIDLIHKNEYHISRTTLYRFFEEGASAAKFDIDWKKLESYINKFANDEKSNVLFHTFEDGENEIIDSFFIFPVEGILFLKSKAFFGFIVIDGTFLKYCNKGNLIIFTTCTGNHEIIPVAYGFCQSENSQDISSFLEIIKQNVPEDTIKVFISDEGTGITSAIHNIFPHANHLNCYLHKKSHLHGKAKKIFERATFAKNKEEYNKIIEDIDKNIPKEEREKLKKLCQEFSPLFYDDLTQGMITNGICESINSILKREKNHTILDELNCLYDILRTKCEDIPFTGDYTQYIKEIKTQFITPVNSICQVCRKGKSKKVDIIEKTNSQTYKFTVIKENDRINCTCNWSKHMGCGCQHIYHVLHMYTDLGNYNQTIHPGYTKEAIAEFQQSLPERINPDDLRINPKHKAIVKRNMKRYKGRRNKCAIDYNK